MIWSRAWAEMQAFVEAAGIPFYTTPQGRGVVPDDHPCSDLAMRSSAFRDADLIIVLGTRMNYIIGHASPPRFGPERKDRPHRHLPRRKSPPRRAMSISRSSATARRCCSNCWMASRARSTPTPTRRGARSWPKARRQKRSVAGADKYAEDGDIHPVRMLEEIKELRQARRDPVRRRAGDAELRAPDDADVHARPSAELGAVRHHGRRHRRSASAPRLPARTSR